MLNYDEDDPPPVPTWQDGYWYIMNRAAENCMWFLQLFVRTKKILIINDAPDEPLAPKRRTAAWDDYVM